MSTTIKKDSASAEALYATQSGFVELSAKDELLHGDDQDADYSLSETSYLGFNVPEAGISCIIYHWFHPRFALASGGVMIFQGLKERTGEGEYVDYRNFMPIPNDISSVTYPTGVEVVVTEPLKELRVVFNAEDGRTNFDVTLSAIMPAAGRADGKHLAQTMKTSGFLELNGERHVVDGYFTRDRSWLSSRAEVSHPIPPQSWFVAAFGDDLAFHVMGADGPELSPDNVRWGYVWKDGRLRSPVKLRQTITRAADLVTPRTVEMEIEDDHGDRYVLHGRVIAMLPMNFWPNMVTHLALCEWNFDGRIGYGDLQDVIFGQSLNQMATQREQDN